VQADKLSSMGLLAAGVAHEVNTPLAVISTYAQMLAKQIAGDAEKAPLLEKIARQTFRASEIVNSLLNFSRTATTEFVSVDMNKTVSETLGLVEHQLTKANVKVELGLDETLPRIRGNPGKLQQVLLNLILNARDAMEQGGLLTIRSLQTPEGSVHVTVADSGSGITPENLARIFDPFYTTKAAKKGTGLGLSISYGIIQEHGGEIEASSAPETGTRFDLSFPALVPPALVPPALVLPAAVLPAPVVQAMSSVKEIAAKEPAGTELVTAALAGTETSVPVLQ
jgi:two-component system NtrC family sensor kinase